LLSINPPFGAVEHIVLNHMRPDSSLRPYDDAARG